MSKKYRLLETVAEDYPVGAIVYECSKCTYGCCSHNEIPCTLKSDGDYPFLGIDKMHLEEIKD